MKSNLNLVTTPQKATRTQLDTELITPDIVKAWKLPPFQRALTVNKKVVGLALEIKETLVIPGVITLGICKGERYLLDGQHRREAFLLSEVPEGFCDVRLHEFDSIPEMGREFVKLNSQLTRMKPDDILRGLEGDVAALRMIREACPWVGYDQIRRSERAPILGMSQLIKTWCGSLTEVPTSFGKPAVDLAEGLNADEVNALVAFLGLAYEAWGRDEEYARLWSSLNLGICMWLFRRLVLMAEYSARVRQLEPETFKRLLMALSADPNYIDWLRGRQLCQKDRAPCYAKVKAIFAKRIQEETGKKPILPQPNWASH